MESALASNTTSFPPPASGPPPPSPSSLPPPTPYSLPPPSPTLTPPLPSASPFPPSFPPPPPATGFCLSLVRPQGSTLHLLWFYFLTSLPVFLFILFLLLRVKQSLRRLKQTGSLVMSAYYGLLWAVCLVNVVRCLIEVLKQPDSSEAAARSLNTGWLVSRFSLVFLETSVVVFLFQGYLVSGVEAMIRTSLISGAAAGLDTALKALLIFKFHIPLFLPQQESVGHWGVWGFWTAHHIVFVALYATILALPFTRWRDRLPARPAFYRYIAVLMAIDIASAVGSLMLAVGSGTGYCVHGLSGYLHSALFPPLLYFTFLSDFFKDDDLIVEDAYYSEMKEAGYFEDWE